MGLAPIEGGGGALTRAARGIPARAGGRGPGMGENTRGPATQTAARGWSAGGTGFLCPPASRGQLARGGAAEGIGGGPQEVDANLEAIASESGPTPTQAVPGASKSDWSPHDSWRRERESSVTAIFSALHRLTARPEDRDKLHRGLAGILAGFDWPSAFPGRVTVTGHDRPGPVPGRAPEPLDAARLLRPVSISLSHVRVTGTEFTDGQVVRAPGPAP